MLPASLFRIVILGCWAIFVLYWIVAARGTKRVVERDSVFNRVLWILLVVAAVTVTRFSPGVSASLGGHLASRSVTLSAVGTLLCVGGLAFAIWARRTLGGNWSGTVTFKQNHELIVQGPYQIVRHPIYTGLLLMFLGSVIAMATGEGFIGFGVVFIGLLLKSRREEAMMTKHFPDSYPQYKARVKALVPYIF